MPTVKLQAKQRRHRRVRTIVQGTATRPRLVVVASLKHTAVQIIDDSSQQTLVHATDAKETGTKSERASAVGKQIAEKAKKAGITTVVFDRGGKLYHGRVKALAESARAAGLEF